MKIKDAALAVDLLAKSKITGFLWGKHGVGKSSLVKQVCFANDWGFVDERLSQCEASDIRGLPARDDENRRTMYYPPSSFPRGDLTMSAIVQKLGESLNWLEHTDGAIPSIEIEGLSPLKQVRLAVEAGRFPTYINKGGNVRIKFDGPEIPYDELRDYTQLFVDLQPRFPQGLYFLDEFNRAEDDVLQASFELVLDRKVGTHALPPGWSTLAAGNFTDGYSVNPFVTDPALLDRFCHLTISSGATVIEDWASYMIDRHGSSAQKVVEYGMQNVKHVYGDTEAKNEISIQPTPRSWEMVVEVMKVADEWDYPDYIVQRVIEGLVGDGNAQKFMKYTCPVDPQKILENGPKSQEKGLRKILQDEYKRGILGALSHGVISFAKDLLDNSRVVNNCLDFAEFLVKEAKENDLAVAFMRNMLTGKAGPEVVDEDKEAARAALLSNTHLSGLVADWEPTKKQKLYVVNEYNARPELKKLMKDVSWGEDDL